AFAGAIGVQHLERDRAPERQVRALVDHAEAALADHALDSVPALDHRSDLDAHGVRSLRVTVPFEKSKVVRSPEWMVTAWSTVSPDTSTTCTWCEPAGSSRRPADRW